MEGMDFNTSRISLSQFPFLEVDLMLTTWPPQLPLLSELSWALKGIIDNSHLRRLLNANNCTLPVIIILFHVLCLPSLCQHPQFTLPRQPSRIYMGHGLMGYLCSAQDPPHSPMLDSTSLPSLLSMLRNNNGPTRQLCIFQLNCNASNHTQFIMINSLNPNDWDVIAIQEPYIDFKGVTWAMPAWWVVYPSKHYNTPAEMRSIMLISKYLATNCWEILSVGSSDISAIHFSADFGQVHLFNIYNDCTHSCTLQHLEQYLLASPPTLIYLNAKCSDIWPGNFNRHDLMWESPDNAQLFTLANFDVAEILINLLVDFGVNTALEPGVPTLEHMVTKNLHRVDNFFFARTN